MSVPNPLVDRVPTRTSDSPQAAYFRGALADRRALVVAELARQTRGLNVLTTRTDAVTISRVRREMRASELECRDLDRMIDAIDRRFAPTWANP